MELLPDNTFFNGLSRDQLDLLMPLFETFTAAAGTMIFKQGDEATHLYVIERGSVTIQYKPYDGPIITLSHLRVGEIFGWSAVVGGETYTSDAMVTTDLQSLRIRGSDLIRLCAEHPTEGFAVLDHLAEAVSPRWTYARQQIQGILEGRAQPAANHASHTTRSNGAASHSFS